MKNTKTNKIISFFGTAIIGLATFASVAFAGTPILSINPSPSVTADSATFSVFYDKNGDVLTSVAVRYGTNTLMQTNTTSQTPGVNSGTLTFTANNLASGTTYYFQAIGISSTGTVTSSRYSFTTKSISAPTVQTYSNPSNISYDSADVSGFYSDGGASLSNLYFEYGPSSSLGSTKSVSFSGASGTVSTTLSGLQSNTKYWYRLVATNQGGTTRGSTYTFTTLNNTNNNPTYPSCYYNGTCYWDGTKWVYYNNNQNNYPNCYYDGTCYWDGTQWTYYKNNNNGCTFGKNCRPLCDYFNSCSNNKNYKYNTYVNVDTTAVSGVTSNSATLSGLVYTNNSNSSAYFEYGTNPSFGRSTQRLYSNNTNTNYVYTVYGLAANTTYYFRIIGESNGDTQIGDIISFKTVGSGATIANTNSGTTGGTTTKNTSTTTNTKSSTSNTNNQASTVSGNGYGQDGSFLAAGAGFSGGSFFPGTILGWLVVILFILLLVMIVKRVFSNYTVVKNT